MTSARFGTPGHTRHACFSISFHPAFPPLYMHACMQKCPSPLRALVFSRRDMHTCMLPLAVVFCTRQAWPHLGHMQCFSRNCLPTRMSSFGHIHSQRQRIGIPLHKCQMCIHALAHSMHHAMSQRVTHIVANVSSTHVTHDSAFSPIVSLVISEIACSLNLPMYPSAGGIGGRCWRCCSGAPLPNSMHTSLHFFVVQQSDVGPCP